MEQIHALGRRKAAVARVYLVAGSGNIVINDRPLEDYFKEDGLRYIVNQPLVLTQTEGQFDIKVTIVGGGIKGQAEAIRLVNEATAYGLKAIKEAEADESVIKLKSLEAFQKAANGQATKIIIPADLQSMAGVITAATEVVKTKKS